MDIPVSGRTPSAAPVWLERAPVIVGLLLVCAAAIVLAGWMLDVRVLTTWLPGVPTMKANTAVAFALAGAALLAHRYGSRTAASAAAAGVLLIGVTGVLEYAAGVDLGIDELLVRDRLVPTGDTPGRMALPTAVAFVVSGCGLLLLCRSLALRWLDGLAYSTAVAALPGLVSHAYDFEGLQPARVPGSAMAVNTSVLLMLLGFALAVERPSSPLKRMLASRGAGGTMVRRLLPLAVAVPFVTGSVLLHLEEAHYIGSAAVVALFVAANIFILGTVALWNALAADRAEFSISRLAAIVESSSDAIVSTDLHGIITSWNGGAERLYGHAASEVIGRPVSVVYPESMQGTMQALLSRVVAGEVISNYETTRVRKNGTTVDVSLAVSPIRDASGDCIGLSAITRDISDRKQLEREARDAELRFRVLLDQAIVGVYTIENGRFGYVNRKMADIFGYTPEEMLAMSSVMDVVDPSDQLRVSENIRQRLSTGRSVQYEALGRRKDGSNLYAEIHGGVIDGESRYLVGMLHDITYRKVAQDALEESEARLKEAQSVAHVGSWELDLRSGALHWSDEVYRIFGVPPRSFGATYEYFLERIHPDDRELVNSAYTQSVATHTAYSIDHRLVTADGTLKFVHERCVTHYDDKGHALRSVGTVQDITDRKLAEDALNRLNNELESRVEQRTAELQAANNELEAFSYSVSHDLRAPLRALQGFSRILVEEHLPALSGEAARYIGIIRDNAAQMGQLVDDLLEFSRLSRQPVRAEIVDVRALALEALAQLEADRADRDVDIRVSELPACQGDPALLRQVLINLLSNALKFTRQTRRAVIEVGTSPVDGNAQEAVYYVRDNGAGFDMQYSGKLFGIFQRLHSAAEYEGTGVGLAIVQRIVHRHGGRVWPEAAPGRGATFYFSLPKDGSHGTQGR